MINPVYTHRCSHTHHSNCQHAVAAAQNPQDSTEVHDSVCKGVVDMRETGRKAFNTQAAARTALNCALQAAANGSTGVGGVLLGPHKEIIAVSCNRVYANGEMVDPTAHGERQLVDWYFEQAKTDKTLPSPQDCTIVTSLDPCLMCTGSILTAGFNVISNSLDVAGGVNWDGKATFEDLPVELRDQAQNHFAYFEVENRSPFQGPEIFGEQPMISSKVSDKSLQAFADSVAQPKASPPEAELQDLKDCQDNKIQDILSKYSPEALSLKFTPDQPDARLAQPLLEAARKSAAAGGKFNAAALIDPKGNLVLVRGSREQDSPLRTPFMELTRAWATMRQEAGDEANKYFAPMHDCLMVTLQGPAPDSQSVMEFGAYGSSIKHKSREEAPSWQYILPRQSSEKLDQTLENLPPHYSEKINIRIDQVQDQALIAACATK